MDAPTHQAHYTPHRQEPVYLVWLKRNLRLEDNPCLLLALTKARAAHRQVQLLYVHEPSLEQDPHYSERHFRFIAQSLDAMDADMAQYGIDHRVLRLKGECVPVLELLLNRRPIAGLYSEEEIGILRTWDRDKAVARWCRKRGIAWTETQHAGVERGRGNRMDWRKQWYSWVSQPIRPWHDLAEGALPAGSKGDAAMASAASPTEPGRLVALPLLPTAQAQAWTQNMPRPLWPASPVHAPKVSGLEAGKAEGFGMQHGGSSNAKLALRDFLVDGAPNYMRNIGKPVESRLSCSRLSPYLAWGNLSLRQAWQAAEVLKQSHGPSRSLRAFQSRLRWRDHFMQKFEMESSMEWASVNSGYHGLNKPLNTAWVNAWETGQTGIPMVDASMRCLNATGYLNFRMRAMLVSFLCHHLWQPWQSAALHLARQFLDFEPGIHYPQLIMQAGETGTNTIRMYNPVKQGLDRDPDGRFVRQWVPELQHCPSSCIHTPWTMDLFEQHASGIRLGENYPLPIVDLAQSGKHARSILWAMRKDPLVRRESQRILAKHTVPSHRIP